MAAVTAVGMDESPAEADRVLELMAEAGLERGTDGLEVYVMCEIRLRHPPVAEDASRPARCSTLDD